MARPTHPRIALRAPAARLAALALLCTGCGPTPAEVGAAILIAAPVTLLTILALHVPLVRLWQRSRPEVALGAPRALVAAGVLVVVAAVAALVAASGDEVPALALLAFWLVGTFTLLVDLIVWRLLFALAPARAPLAPLIAVGLTHWPAPLLLAQGSDTGSDLLGATLLVYVYGSAYGVVPALAYVAAVVEAVVRGARAPTLDSQVTAIRPEEPGAPP
ncbi:MAG: hypothetical protein HY908_06165 [Myxococcales bacterium]|nr:hypothetical protein [Myxococcales bacterium]